MTDRGSDLIATASETVGPFFHFGLSTDHALGSVADRTVEGEFITLRVRIVDGDAQPVPDALVEIWQVDAGRQRCRGIIVRANARVPRLRPAADSRGWHVRVRDHPSGPGKRWQGGLQASHINVCLFARGLLRQLHTRIYFNGDPAIEHDAVLALVPAARRHTLLATPDPQQPGRWVFDMRLQGGG